MSIRELLLASTTLDFLQPPPVLSGALQAQLREITGRADPYHETKVEFNRLATELYASMAEEVRNSTDPFLAAVRVAIAGNVIDLGAKSGLTNEEVRHSASTALKQTLVGDTEAFRQAVLSAKKILYLCDNAGEIIFDRALIEQMPAGRVTVVVRGQAVLNDATLEDALQAQFPAEVEIIDNGSALPGTVLEDCSPGFRKRLRGADLIVAKGQGNFESLQGTVLPLFCLFRVKCATVASHCGHPIGSHLVWNPGKD